MVTVLFENLITLDQAGGNVSDEDKYSSRVGVKTRDDDRSLTVAALNVMILRRQQHLPHEGMGSFTGMVESPNVGPLPLVAARKTRAPSRSRLISI
jgi:hypothetical protein